VTEGNDGPQGMSVKDMFNLLRQDLNAGIARMEARLEKVVTHDLFVAEQKRIDGRFRDVGEDVTELRAANAGLEKQIAAEVTARKDAEANMLRQQQERDQQIERQRGTIRWSIVGILASPIVSAIVVFVVSGGLAREP
jgi:hypothetical protein